MTKNIKLLLSGSALALLGVLALQGCGSSSGDDSAAAGSAGKSSAGGSAGASTGGTSSSAGASTGGTSSSAGTGGKSSGGSSAGGSSGAATTGEAGESAGGAADEAHPTADECTTFCTLDLSTCTAGNAAYASSGECQTDCLAYALGDDSDPTRMVAETGNNFACRAYHLENAVKNAANAALLTLHCGHTAEASTICL